jgi:hypothetical protein
MNKILDAVLVFTDGAEAVVMPAIQPSTPVGDILGFVNYHEREGGEVAHIEIRPRTK